MSPNSKAATPVLIVGAGPTGLVLALWLTRLGVRVRIIDKTAEPGTTSRAVAVQARTLELYHQIGIADAVVAASLRISAVNLWVGGRRAAHLELGALGEGVSPYPYALTYAQDAHERMLVDQLASLDVQVERSTELVGFDQDDDGVHATIRCPDGAEERLDAPYIAGCDGAHSAVRTTLGIGFPGSTYSGVFYVADAQARGPAANGEIHVDIEDAEFVAVFPLKGEGRLRLIGPLADDPAAERTVTFEDVSPRAVQHLDLEVKQVNWFSTYRVHHRVASRFRVGRAFLLGDAAHIHSPVGGQGMNTGIGDAVNLAWKLAAVLRDGYADWILSTYEPERIAFARRLVATTDRVFTIITKPGGLARFVRTRLVPLVAPIFTRLPGVRPFLFRTVSQTALAYRDSALSEGKAGSVSAGDRLPWVPNAEGDADNFAPLMSNDWQVHVYGQSPPEVEEGCKSMGLPLHVFTWCDATHRAGFARSALYLVRPDGYVALASAAPDLAALTRYVQRLRHG